MNNAFRTQLMQQIVLTARSQSRPPLALIGWGQDDESTISTSAADLPVDDNSPSSVQTLAMSSIGATSLSHNTLSSLRDTHQSVTQQSLRLSSSLAISEDSCIYQDEDQMVEVSTLFQNMIRTRRSNSSFLPSFEPAEFWKDALQRAVLCAYDSPNHKRTEALSFKRIISPSPTSEKLSNIAYNLSLRDDQSKSIECRPSVKVMLEKATRKKAKWASVPAFLVAIVSSRDGPTVSSDATEDNLYDEMPFCPPASERELEDYAAACAAVQNVLLSLHAEQIASKWTTGPMIRTRAFRELVEAQPLDRIVGLIMVGLPDEQKSVGRVRRKRSLGRDAITDI